MKIIKLLYGLFIFFILGINSKAIAQITINGGSLSIGNNAKVVLYNNILSNTDILGNGRLVMKDYATQTINTNGKLIPNLEIDNLNNINLSGNTSVRDTLLFTNGKILINGNNLILGAQSKITNSSNSKFIVTNGNGKVIKSVLNNTPFNFPVGNDVSTYNPVIISNQGTADSIGVKCMANAYTNGTTGAAFTTDLVDASWELTESVAGGSNITLTAFWNASDELPAFNRLASGIANYVTAPTSNAGWDLINSQLGAASGTNPYSYTRTGITNLGAFAIGSKKLLSSLIINAKVFLQGAYDSTASLMRDSLRRKNLIPTVEPYSGIAGFTHIGSGGNETASSLIVGSAATADNNAIVDWIFLQLHDANTGNIICTKSALLQRDGDIVDTDGISPVNMVGNLPGNYYLSIRHRNHLGVKSQNLLTLYRNTSFPYDFTTSLSQAFAGSVTNTPMTLLKNSVYGMWAGNANADNYINIVGGNTTNNDYLKLLNKLGTSTNMINNVYENEDLNLDGVIRMTGLSSSLNDYLILFDAVRSTISTITQPVF